LTDLAPTQHLVQGDDISEAEEPESVFISWGDPDEGEESLQEEDVPKVAPEVVEIAIGP
jgi:hypothetical protein